jgi:peptidyl-prolyl cis-trans isomerase SDCCAG10
VVPLRALYAGEEAEEEDAEAAEAAAKLKIKSAHDLLEDERLAKEPAVDVDLERWGGGVSAGPVCVWAWACVWTLAKHLLLRDPLAPVKDQGSKGELAAGWDACRVREAMRAAKAAQQETDGGDEAGGDDGDFGSHMLKRMQAKRKAMGIEERQPGADAAAQEQGRGQEPELDYGESEEEGGSDGGEQDEGGRWPAERAAHSGRLVPL